MATNVSFSNQIEELKQQINAKNNSIIGSSLSEAANALLHNTVSELSAEVMLCKIREEEWDE